MRMYIGSYWVDFPMSEYGGMWAVVARDDEQLFDILKESQSGFFGDELDDDIRQAIKNATPKPNTPAINTMPIYVNGLSINSSNFSLLIISCFPTIKVSWCSWWVIG